MSESIEIEVLCAECGNELEIEFDRMTNCGARFRVRHCAECECPQCAGAWEDGHKDGYDEGRHDGYEDAQEKEEADQ